MYFILLQVRMQAEYIKDSALKIWCPEISKFFNFQTSKVCMITWYDLFNHLKFVLVKKEFTFIYSVLIESFKSIDERLSGMKTMLFCLIFE